jgi:hypothetical protein
MTKFFDDWVTYKFTHSEMELLDFVAKLRSTKTSEKTKEQIRSNLDPFVIQQWGVYSEYAVAKKLNLFFDWDCEYRIPFPMDLKLDTGETIDIKCTKWHGTRINKKEDNYKEKPNFYIACVFREDVDAKNILHRAVKIVGFIDAEKFDEETRTSYDDKLRPYSWIGREHFTDIHDFKAYIKPL